MLLDQFIYLLGLPSLNPQLLLRHPSMLLGRFIYLLPSLNLHLLLLHHGPIRLLPRTPISQSTVTTSSCNVIQPFHLPPESFRIIHGSKPFPNSPRERCIYCGQKTQRRCPDCPNQPYLCQTLSKDCHSLLHSSMFDNTRYQILSKRDPIHHCPKQAVVDQREAKRKDGTKVFSLSNPKMMQTYISNCKYMYIMFNL